MAKIRAGDDIASDVFLYVDDVNVLGSSAKECWAAMRQFAFWCNHFGIQDAPRKCKGPNQEQGLCAGSVVYSKTHLEGLMEQVKWDKLKGSVK